MAGTRTRLDPGVRREQILTAAREVFVADDYANASMEAVAARAGVTTGLVNHYFGTKRDLYLAVVANLAAGCRRWSPPTGRISPSKSWSPATWSGFLDEFERNNEVLLGAARRAGRARSRSRRSPRSWGAPATASSCGWPTTTPATIPPRLLLAAAGLPGRAGAAAEWFRATAQPASEVQRC